MKSVFKMVSAVLLVMLFLAVLPAAAAGAGGYYPPCNRAVFIKDVTVPDGSRVAPGENFTKTWQVLNAGTCTWTTDYEMVFAQGENFGATSPQKLTTPVPPGATVNLSLDMVAPGTPGIHYSHWKLSNGSGEVFGVGRWGQVAIFAKINVVIPPAVTYDFAANVTAATWSSGAGSVTPNSVSAGDPFGTVWEVASPKLENGTSVSHAGLSVEPNAAYNGFIQGVYPEYTVKKGDRFQATVGCNFGASGCFVLFSLKYQIDGGPVYTHWAFKERLEGLNYNANINLDRLAGKNVKFILHVSSYGPPVGDSAVWIHPVIVGKGASNVVSPRGWSSNDMGDFSFEFPSDSVVSNVNKISLPITPGTNLGQKYVEVSTKTLAAAGDPCLSSNPGPSAPAPVTFNGIEFMKETGGEGGAGNFTDWVAYSAAHPDEPLTCVSLTFVLRYSNPGVFDPPRPEFNKAAESIVFDQIMQRFKWMTP